MSWAINWEIVREDGRKHIDSLGLDSEITIVNQWVQCHPAQDIRPKTPIPRFNLAKLNFEVYEPLDSVCSIVINTIVVLVLVQFRKLSLDDSRVQPLYSTSLDNLALSQQIQKKTFIKLSTSKYQC
jgi:hypothetical protein